MSSEGEEGEAGDLGLGRGYRPGGIPVSDSECEVRRGWGVDSPPNSPNRVNCNGYSISNGDGSCDLTATPLPSAGKNGFLLKKTKTIANGRISAKQKRKLFSRNRTYAVAQDICDSDSEENSIRHSLTEAYPRYGDVVLGTSISQQKKLFYQELKELFPVCAPFDQNQEVNLELSQTADASELLPIIRLLQEHLNLSHFEIEQLQSDLQQHKIQLDSKYRAIRILQKQNFASESINLNISVKSKEMTEKLQQEINRLEFEMESKQTALMNSQETWMQRFNRVSEENIALMATLENRSDDMRKLMDEKTALARERDELLALLDVNERQRFEALQSTSSEDGYSGYTSTELAVLGACQCRIKSPDPCGCAHAAAKMKMDIAHLKMENDKHVKSCEDAMITTDAYRIAFEEQLDRNRLLMKEIVDMTMLPTPAKMSKAKSAMKWFIQQLREDASLNKEESPSSSKPEDTPPSTTPSTPSADHNGDAPEDINCNNAYSSPLAGKSELELIQMLSDMITDRSEALGHQRLAARMLASKTKELENKLQEMGDEVFSKEKSKS